MNLSYIGVTQLWQLVACVKFTVRCMRQNTARKNAVDIINCGVHSCRLAPPKLVDISDYTARLVKALRSAIMHYSYMHYTNNNNRASLPALLNSWSMTAISEIPPAIRILNGRRLHRLLHLDPPAVHAN